MIVIEKDKTTVPVAAIKEGTVIDHISPGKALLLLNLLNCMTPERQITVGMNLVSRSKGLKDIIKIEHYELNEKECQKLAIIAPDASINLIHDYKVFKKFKVEIPQELSGIFSCPNRSCITNAERIPTLFTITRFRQKLQLHCRY